MNGEPWRKEENDKDISSICRKLTIAELTSITTTEGPRSSNFAIQQKVIPTYIYVWGSFQLSIKLGPSCKDRLEIGKIEGHWLRLTILEVLSPISIKSYLPVDDPRSRSCADIEAIRLVETCPNELGYQTILARTLPMVANRHFLLLSWKKYCSPCTNRDWIVQTKANLEIPFDLNTWKLRSSHQVHLLEL